jgi:hypothetical protein
MNETLQRVVSSEFLPGTVRGDGGEGKLELYECNGRVSVHNGDGGGSRGSEREGGRRGAHGNPLGAWGFGGSATRHTTLPNYIFNLVKPPTTLEQEAFYTSLPSSFPLILLYANIPPVFLSSSSDAPIHSTSRRITNPCRFFSLRGFHEKKSIIIFSPNRELIKRTTTIYSN